MSKDLKQFMENKPVQCATSLWYIASPYSHPDPLTMSQRVVDVAACVDAIVKNYDNVKPQSPILETVGMNDRGVIPKEGWYKYDFGLLNKADRLIVLMLDGWESSIGVGLEIAFALGRGMPISYYTLEDIMSDEIPF